jgi:uncharacterized linocin/CFP29 family protein
LHLLVGRNDSELQPIKDAARRIAFTEDATIFEGYAEAGIEGIGRGTSNPVVALPASSAQQTSARSEIGAIAPRYRQSLAQFLARMFYTEDMRE